MKALFTMFLLAFGLSLAAIGQCGNVTVASGCVGACGSSWSYTYTVQAGDVGPYGVGLFCLGATSNSLCPSHNAAAVMTRNSFSVQTGNLNQGNVLSMKCHVGDVFYVQVDAVFVDPYIDCFWFGETQFSFMHQ